MDLSKLSNEDLDALQNKQYDKLSNEGLDFLHSQSQTLAQPPRVQFNQGSAFGPQGDRLMNMQAGYDDNGRSLPMIGSLAGSLVPVPGGMTAGAAIGSGLKQMLQQGQPASLSEGIKDTVTNGVLPEVGGGLLNKVGSGVQKGGDWLMQKAVGMKKYIPGVGEELANQGVAGTRGMMKNQVNKAIDSTGSRIGELGSGLENVSTDTASSKLTDEAMRLVGPDGFVKPEDMSKYRKLMSAADNITSRGGDTGMVAGDVGTSARATAGRIANEAGRYRDLPSTAVKASVNGAEQAGWSEAMKDAYAQANPGEANALADADKSYSLLSKAKRPLNTPQSIPGSAIGTASRLGIGSILGYKEGGVPGAVAGAALSTPAAMSIGGRAGIGLGKLMSSPATADTAAALANLLQGQQGNKQ